jgi:hypothetical protein
VRVCVVYQVEAAASAGLWQSERQITQPIAFEMARSQFTHGYMVDAVAGEAASLAKSLAD